MAQPDFLCIGAQKAGTTWLDYMFNSHTKIWTPPVKELQYFNELFMADSFKWTKSHRLSHGEKAKQWALKAGEVDANKVALCELIANEPIGQSWYEKVFDYAPEGTVKGEMTPEYSLLSEDSVSEIAKQYPDLKIIFVMRDPVERALSGIKMRLLQQGFNEKSSQKEIDDFVIACASDWDVIERGNYQRILASWSKVFGTSKCLNLLSQDLLSKPDKVLREISIFLGCDYKKFKADKSERVHVGKSFEISKFAIGSVRKAQEENTKHFESIIQEASL